MLDLLGCPDREDGAAGDTALEGGLGSRASALRPVRGGLGLG
ncbi:hypothetical protein LCGC14_0745270 [marine sediment metagenome]|uniref:Uncharacterized protein n=1 Tax=marine sediment metagenome TaxID=412755 RepID=A0A0F9Q9R2_9ZZZZ